MARVLDLVLVVDIGSTCWEGTPPAGQISEIIEIGLCTVDLRQLKRVEKRSIMVKPMKSVVSQFCTDLTGIDSSMVENAMPLSDALKILEREYESRGRLMASWGDYDRNQFERNCRDYQLRYPFGPTHLNVKNLYAIANHLPREIGIDEAFRRLGWEMEGRHHRGVDDAWNIASIFCHMLDHIRHGKLS